jgi:hypothetical protein
MSEVRVAVERAFLAYDVPKIAELLGTIAVEDRGLTVVYRDVSTGELHRVRNDVEAIRVKMPAETLEQLVGEVVSQTVHALSYRTYRGTDRWGVREWTVSPEDPVDWTWRWSGPARFWPSRVQSARDRGIDSRTRRRCCRGMRAGKYE